MDASTLALTVMVTTVGAVVLYGICRDAVSRRRLREGRCVRCGISTPEPLDLTAEELHPTVPLIVCWRCATKTRRNHRIALWTFVVLGGIGLSAAILGIAGDLLRGGGYDLRDYWWLYSILVGPLLAMLRIFWRAARPSEARRRRSELSEANAHDLAQEIDRAVWARVRGRLSKDA